MSSSFVPGDAVRTAYGTGIVISVRDDDHGHFCVRLWRIPGRSIASSSLAILNPSALLEKIPVVPGMITRIQSREPEGSAQKESEEQVLIHCYNAADKSFLVSKLPDDEKEPTATQFRTISSTQMRPSASAQFYPFLETLMKRADETVEMTRTLLQSDTTRQLIEKTEQAASQAAETTGKFLTEQKKSLTDEAAPAAEQGFQQVVKLMKDESLTDLLEICKGRLEELVQTTNISETTRKALAGTGIQIEIAEVSSFQDTRKAALDAVKQLLEQQQNQEDFVAMKEQVFTQFSTTFDSLAAAAKSDRQLQEFFGQISDKTALWQEATGRLLQTRSASLFMEGASRIQARAAALFQQTNFAGDIGSHFTKSFTEGDAAMARVKSLELGEALKNRLVQAIELRSDSVGGLDGIIAGALSALDKKTGGADIQSLLLNLQSQATSATHNTHETLLAILSSQSEYREVALLKLERTLCSLEKHLGGTPEDIAALARGEGGTSKIFEPIAKQAMRQIESQLDVAESQVEDPTILQMLQRVRKIMSGELSLNDVMDEVVSVLNDEKVVAASETFVQHSEEVLDAIEGVSGNKVVVDALQIAERAGITKDSVMKEIGKLDVDELIGTAGSAVTDEKARRELLSSATDTALDFALRVLPSMPVPPFEGAKDGLIYRIGNLSMEGFHVRKESIHIILAGMQATKMGANTATPSDGVDVSSTEESAGESMEVHEVSADVKPTELLIIDIQEISAVFDNAEWSFEQTYLPYLKGEGKVDVKMSGGSIRLQFELRRRKRKNDEGAEFWEPVLCLHDRDCSITEVDMKMHGDSRITWIINKLAGIFRGPLRDYVVRTIVRIIANRSGWILERLNEVLSPYWELILRTAKLSMDDLVEADENVVVEEEKENKQPVIELVWRERLPLGMNLLTNDESGMLKVVDFPRGSQARSVCERRNLDPVMFEGATVVAVNGTEYDNGNDAFDALREPGRPKTIRFELAESDDAEKLRQFVEASQLPRYAVQEQIRTTAKRKYEFRSVFFETDRDLGIAFGPSPDSSSLVVTSFLESPDGIVYEAEKSNQVRIGDILSHINGILVVGKQGSTRAIDLLQEHATRRPLTLNFCDPYMHNVHVEKVEEMPGADYSGGPDELFLEESPRRSGARRISVTGFKPVSGMAESGGILIGDYLVFVNGTPVGAGCRWLGVYPTPPLEKIFEMLRDESAYPIGLTFARPTQGAGGWDSTFGDQGLLRDDEAETICITAENQERIGCIFDEEESGDIVVRDFHGVSGVFSRAFTKCVKPSLHLPLSVESLNGQFVPSYASVEIVRSAIRRGWKSEKGVTVLLCDDALKAWIEASEGDGSKDDTE